MLRPVESSFGPSHKALENPSGVSHSTHKALLGFFLASLVKKEKRKGAGPLDPAISSIGPEVTKELQTEHSTLYSQPIAQRGPQGEWF
jgi:hypothetical protein